MGGRNGIVLPQSWYIVLIGRAESYQPGQHRTTKHVVTGEKWALSYGDNMDYNGDMMVDKDIHIYIYIYKDDYHTFMNPCMKLGFLSHGGSPVVTSRRSIGEWSSMIWMWKIWPMSCHQPISMWERIEMHSELGHRLCCLGFNDQHFSACLLPTNVLRLFLVILWFSCLFWMSCVAVNLTCSQVPATGSGHKDDEYKCRRHHSPPPHHHHHHGDNSIIYIIIIVIINNNIHHHHHHPILHWFPEMPGHPCAESDLFCTDHRRSSRYPPGTTGCHFYRWGVDGNTRSATWSDDLGIWIWWKKCERPWF